MPKYRANVKQGELYRQRVSPYDPTGVHNVHTLHRASYHFLDNPRNTNPLNVMWAGHKSSDTDIQKISESVKENLQKAMKGIKFHGGKSNKFDNDPRNIHDHYNDDSSKVVGSKFGRRGFNYINVNPSHHPELDVSNMMYLASKPEHTTIKHNPRSTHQVHKSMQSIVHKNNNFFFKESSSKKPGVGNQGLLTSSNTKSQGHDPFLKNIARPQNENNLRRNEKMFSLNNMPGLHGHSATGGGNGGVQLPETNIWSMTSLTNKQRNSKYRQKVVPRNTNLITQHAASDVFEKDSRAHYDVGVPDHMIDPTFKNHTPFTRQGLKEHDMHTPDEAVRESTLKAHGPQFAVQGKKSTFKPEADHTPFSRKGLNEHDMYTTGETEYLDKTRSVGSQMHLSKRVSQFAPETNFTPFNRRKMNSHDMYKTEEAEYLDKNRSVGSQMHMAKKSIQFQPEKSLTPFIRGPLQEHNMQTLKESTMEDDEKSMGAVLFQARKENKFGPEENFTPFARKKMDHHNLVQVDDAEFLDQQAAQPTLITGGSIVGGRQANKETSIQQQSVHSQKPIPMSLYKSDDYENTAMLSTMANPNLSLAKYPHLLHKRAHDVKNSELLQKVRGDHHSVLGIGQQNVLDRSFHSPNIDGNTTAISNSKKSKYLHTGDLHSTVKKRHTATEYASDADSTFFHINNSNHLNHSRIYVDKKSALNRNSKNDNSLLINRGKNFMHTMVNQSANAGLLASSSSASASSLSPGAGWTSISDKALLQQQ